MMLPTPDVVLSERVVLCETKLPDEHGQRHSNVQRPASVCGVLQLAARKAVGCAAEGAVVQAEPSLVLSPDCKHLAVKEPCSKRVCLLSAQDGFKDVLTTLVPLPVSKEGEITADTVLSCSWSPDSRLLLVACKSSAVYLFDNTGRLLCHWDPSWSWGQLQLVSACHGPGNTILLLTAARVVYLVAHPGCHQQQHATSESSSSSSTAGGAVSSGGGLGQQQQAQQQQQQFQQQQVLEKYSVKRYHSAVSAIGYDDKSGLLVIAGDGHGKPGSSSSSSTSGSTGAAADFAAEGVTVSVWQFQLQQRQLQFKFALGAPQAGPGMLASTAAGFLGVDTAAAAAEAATRWAIVFSPLLEYVALLTGAGSVYLLSLTDGCLVDPAASFAGRSVASHTSGSSHSSSLSAAAGTERGGILGPKPVPLTVASAAADGLYGGGGDSSSSGGIANVANRSVAWWGPRVLAVGTADGSVSLARLPGSVNILGAAPARFAPGSCVVANHSGHRGLLVVEPITLAAAAAASSSHGAAAVASSLQTTALETAFAANASAAVGVSALLAARRALASSSPSPGSLSPRGLRSDGVGDDKEADDGPDGGPLEASRATAWLAKRLGVSRDELKAASAAAGSADGGTWGIAGWRLVLLAERTPQQLMQVHLRCHDWGSALHISKAYGLDTDAVYLARWAASPVSRSSISDNLPKVKSRRAAVTECLTRVAPDYESARLLISYGLRETAKWAAPPPAMAAAAAGAAAAAAAAGADFTTPVKGVRPGSVAAPAAVPATPGGLTGPAGPLGAAAGPAEAQSLDSMPAAKAAEVRWWRLQRLKLLALHDRLEISVALNRGSYDPAIFSVLRTEPLPKAAAAIAAAGDVGGLAVLLQRHKTTLGPRLLQLLSALPESLDVRMYAALLPRATAAATGPGPAGAAAAAAPRLAKPVGVGSIHAPGQRKVDWVETEETFRFLAAAATATPGVANFGAASGGAEEPPVSSPSGGPGHLVSAPSIDREPGLPIAVDLRGTSGSSSSSGLRTAGSFDITSYALCPDEAAVMLHATEELERYCSSNGINRRLPPNDQQVANWFGTRALQLDAATGQLPASVKLLELAVDKGYGQFTAELCNSSSNSSSTRQQQQQERHSLSSIGSTRSSIEGREGAGGCQDVAADIQVPLESLLIQARVLMQLLNAWWPVQEQQQQQQRDGSTDGASLQSPRPTANSGQHVSAAAAAAAAEAAAAVSALQPIWSVTLQQWLTASLFPQLLSVLKGSSKDLLQQDLQERVLPLLTCYPHHKQVTALQQLILYWVTDSQAGTAGERSSTGSGSSYGSSGSSSLALAAALVGQEAEAFQAAATAAQAAANGGVAAAILRAQQEAAASPSASPRLGGDGRWQPWQQHEQLQTDPDAAEAASRPVTLIWGGDVAALVTAISTAVSSCTATNEWARLEQLLSSAATALEAAAALEGLSSQQQQQQQANVSYGSELVGNGDLSRQQQQQQQEDRPESRQSRKNAGGWEGDWSDDEVDDWQDAEGPEQQHLKQQQQLKQSGSSNRSSLEVASGSVKAAMSQYPLSPVQVRELQEQLSVLRGRVQAARLLTKHGCCVSIVQLAEADSAAVRELLAKLLGRAERLGGSWPEAQWAQVWHDLLEARQAGLSAQLPAEDLAAAFLRVLLLAQQYHLAVQLLPMYAQAPGSTPGSLGGTPTAAVAEGAAQALEQALLEEAGHAHAHAGAAEGERVHTAEAALAALTGGGGGNRFTGSSRFGVRRALHHAAGAAVSTAVSGSAKLMGASAHLVGSTAHLVGSTAQAVQVGTGGVVGATAGLVSGTASLVSSAATFAAETAAKASSKVGSRGAGRGSTVLKGAAGLLSVAAAEAVVVDVSKELLASATGLADPAVAAAEAVLQLLPEDCKAAASQRASVAVLRRLPEFGVSLLPAQLTSLPDKHQLLQRILFGRQTYAAAAAAAGTGTGGWDGSSSSKVLPWRRLGDVLELAALLGFGAEEEQNEVRLLAAEAALSAGEVSPAAHLALQLAAARYGPAWSLAAELACPQRYAAQRQQRVAKVQKLAQQEQQVQQQLKQQQQQAEAPQDTPAGDETAPAAPEHSSSVQVDSEALATAASSGTGTGQQEDQQGTPRSATPPTPAPGTPATADAAINGAAGADAEPRTGLATMVASQQSDAGLERDSSAADDAADDSGGPKAGVSLASTAAADSEMSESDVAACAMPTDAVPDAPATPLAPETASATGEQGAEGASGQGAEAARKQAQYTAGPEHSKPASSSSSTKVPSLSPRERQKLLSFASCYCPDSELPPLTDELMLVQQEMSLKQQRQGHKQQQEPTQGQQQQVELLLPLQRPASESFQQQKQLLLQMAVSAAATAGSALTGLFSLGDPELLLSILLSSNSPADADQLLNQALTSQFIAGSLNGSSGYSCLQRLLAVGAAAQLLMLLQHQPQALPLLAAAGTGSSDISISSGTKLPQQQQLLQQALYAPLGRLYEVVQSLQQRGQQLPAEAVEAANAAASYLIRLRQVSDGRQLKQWLPDIETARFFAGDRPYQEQVLIQLASKAGQLAVQQVAQPAGTQQASTDRDAAEALMAEAQHLAASYGADPWQLELWFVHSLIVYAPDIQQPEAQALLAAHAPLLLQRPAAAAAHLYYSTYPLLPAAAAGHCSCVLGLISSALQAFCAAQQPAAETSAGNETAGGSDMSKAIAIVSAMLPPLERLKELLIKSSKALSGLAVKAMIAGHVALMVGPAVAAATAAAAAAAGGGGGAAAVVGPSAGAAAAEANGTPQPQDAAVAAAAVAAGANVDVPMIVLEAVSAVAAFVSTPGKATIASKFIKHLTVVAEMLARAAAGDKARQQQVAKLVQGVPPGLPHLLLVAKAMCSNGTEQQQQRQGSGADVEDATDGPGLLRMNSADSFKSAMSTSSSLAGVQAGNLAAKAIEWATARARYASSSGRQQLPNCNALQLAGLASWLVLQQQNPLPEDAIGQLQPLALGPGLQLQLLSDVITLIINPEAQLQGAGSGGSAGGTSSGGSSRSSSFHVSGSTGELGAAAAAAAVAAAAAGGAAAAASQTTALMREDAAAIAAWRPPVLPTDLAPRRRELLQPLIKAAMRIVAAQMVSSAMAAAGLSGAMQSTEAEVAAEEVAEYVADPQLDQVHAAADAAAAIHSSSSNDELQQPQPSGVLAGLASLQLLLEQMGMGGNFSAVAALQFVYQLAELQLWMQLSVVQDSQQQRQQEAQEEALAAVAAVLGHLTLALLHDVKQALEAEAEAEAADSNGEAGPAVAMSVAERLQLLISFLEAPPPPAASASAAQAADTTGGTAGSIDADVSPATGANAASAAEGAAAAATAVAGGGDDSWLAQSLQQLRSQLWQQLQQHQAQLPAEAYSSSLVAGLLEAQESISSGTVWQGWALTALAGAPGADAVRGAGKPAGGAGLLLARTMTALSKQFPGLKATADDLSSIEAACTLFSRVLLSSSSLQPGQLAALSHVLTDVWREGVALPHAASAEQGAADGPAAEKGLQTEAALADAAAEQQGLEQLAASIGLPIDSCRVSELHSCWLQLLTAMLTAGCIQQVLVVLDKVAAAAIPGAVSDTAAAQQQQQQVVVLPLLESEAQQFVATAGAHIGPGGQAVLGLLMPYRSCQQAALEELLQGKLLVGAGEPWAGQLLLLLLLRAQLPAIAAAAPAASAAVDGSAISRGDTDSNAVVQQLYHLYSLLLQPVLAAPVESGGAAWVYVTCLFPHAVSQLCLASNYASAAALVAAKMRPSYTLCTLQGALLTLQRYLEVTMQQHRHQETGVTNGWSWLPCCEAWLTSKRFSAAHIAHAKLTGAMRVTDSGVVGA